MRKAYDEATAAAESRKEEFKEEILSFLDENNEITKEKAGSILGVETEVAGKYLRYLDKEGVLVEKEEGAFVKK
jgi:Fic family protein